MKPATFLLSVIVAVSTLVQAAIFYADRDTPYRNALFEKKASALISVVEDAYFTCDFGSQWCRAYRKEGQPRDECMQQANARLRSYQKAESALKLLGEKELLTKICSLTMALMDRNLAGKPEQACIAAVDQFVNDTRNTQGLDRLSADLLARLRDKQWSAITPIPETQ